MASRVPFLLLVLYWFVQSLTLGVSDDEAYYWVLSRTPALGYVYHPPLVAWLIALFEKLLAWSGLPREFILRLPGILLTSSTILLGISWLGRFRNSRGIDTLSWSWIVLPGLAAMTWMMVPDHSLLFGWMLCFWATWRIIEEPELHAGHLALLALGAAIGLLSKFSAVLYCASSALALLLFSRHRLQALLALTIGVVLAAAPILIWNSQNDWAALIYQFRSRHSGAAWNLRRYGTFWSSQLLFAGPLLIAALGNLGRTLLRPRSLDRSEWYLLLFFLPSVIFLIQPGFSEFKPHWALVCWLPMGLWTALRTPEASGRPLLARIHRGYVLTLLALALPLTHFPISSWITEKWTRKPANPLFDVSNDLTGWSGLPEFLESQGVSAEVPVIGARYQTASQAAFALWPRRTVGLVPTTLAETKEWPQLDGWVSEQGSARWPTLLRPVVFVRDDRYVHGPDFPGATCNSLGSLDSPRFGFAAKRIHVWLCSSGMAPPATTL